jgi:hypothetical protein
VGYLRGGSGAMMAALLAGACAQKQPLPPPPPPSAPARLTLVGAAERAAGVSMVLSAGGATSGSTVKLQRLVDAERWVTVKTATASQTGTARLTYDPLRPSRRYRLRAALGDVASPALTVQTRHITLAALGDVNFGDGVGAVMDSRGALWPWRDVAPTLRRADIAFGNLECSISNRGVAVPKAFNFRGRPDHLAKVVRFAGLDVLNLANNHAGDFGMLALLDTVRAVRRAGALPVGAGATLAAARRPQVVSRLGLRVAFVGFSDIGPASFFATANSPGTSNATFRAIAASVRDARRQADVVIATFHWGIERSTMENARRVRWRKPRCALARLRSSRHTRTSCSRSAVRARASTN